LEPRAEKAKDFFLDGYNCAQSVLCAYCDETAMDFEQSVKLASSFGGGMGRLREVCGAVTGMFMVTGLKYGYTSPNDDETKAKHYELIQSLAKRFKEENGSIICRDLLELGDAQQGPVPDKRTADYYQHRRCAQLIENAGKMLDELIENEKTEEES